MEISDEKWFEFAFNWCLKNNSNTDPKNFIRDVVKIGAVMKETVNSDISEINKDKKKSDSILF